MWNPIGRSEFDKDMHMWVKDCIFKHFFSDQPTKKSLEFTPGIIVKFAVNEPIEDEKKVKQRIRAAVMENVSYVDARIGQRFVSSIGNIEKAMRVFNCLCRSDWFGQSEIVSKLTTISPHKTIC